MLSILKVCLLSLFSAFLLTGCSNNNSNTAAPSSPTSPSGGAGSGQWTWVSGSHYGTYGTQGTADASNVPGARYGSVSWIDHSGNLWLLGGWGQTSPTIAATGSLNDLWQYKP